MLLASLFAALALMACGGDSGAPSGLITDSGTFDGREPTGRDDAAPDGRTSDGTARDGGGVDAEPRLGPPDCDAYIDRKIACDSPGSNWRGVCADWHLASDDYRAALNACTARPTCGTFDGCLADVLIDGCPDDGLSRWLGPFCAKVEECGWTDMQSDCPDGQYSSWGCWSIEARDAVVACAQAIPCSSDPGLVWGCIPLTP